MAGAKIAKGPTRSLRGARNIWGLLVVLVLVLAGTGIAIFRPRPKAVSEMPTLAEKVLSKSRPLVNRRQYAQAIALMSAYVEANPNDVEVRPLLAESQLSYGDFAQAERTTDQILLRAPQMARALWLKGRLVERRGQDAAGLYRSAADSEDASGDIWANYAVRLVESGQKELAKHYLERARSAGVTDARTLGPLGQLALQEGKAALAERLLSEALETAPGSSRLWAMLAEAQIQAGKSELAADTLAQAVSDPRCEPELLLQAASVHCQVGRIETAQAYLQRASGSLGDDHRFLAVAKRIAARKATTSPVR